jgi:hypothetical protein
MSVTWSHSSLKDYEGCPRRYHEVRVLKRAKQKDTSQTLYGTAVHAAAENYVKDKTPIPEEFNFMYPVVEHVLAKGPIHHPEYEMALDIGCSPCAWDSKDKWVRGIVDLLVIDPENYTVWLVDYKTGGNRYPDTGQLDLMALMVFAHFPHIRVVKAALLFVIKGTMVKHKVQREDAPELWNKYRERVARIENSMTNGVWNPKQSALCKWCPAVACEHNPEH